MIASVTGGPGKVGEVIAIVNFTTETDHNAAEVTWQNGDTNVYRLGYNGRLDLKCIKPVKGGCYYKDHLPTLSMKGLSFLRSVVTEIAFADGLDSDHAVQYNLEPVPVPGAHSIIFYFMCLF